ncbi:hypothetical protein HJTV-2_gp100 [Haloarcula virus HJTV-2]|uniref:Uncharacterized protein n=2 Tax=Haloferacalesvirus TaxID=2843389 RepID=A0AAE8XVV6_9CAUD|nr:hypothetical protein M1M33_gp047 [Haloarcula virus HJTV-2]YP_010358528.1 hypothetical protein M1M41_gp041 [Halorubrum sodomense tailed virus 4]UBF21979.1 hypothetical protein HJTV-3_gp90 [Haloarcula virus HJTV-3]UBF22108.1 hypothetical protein HRTV-15_gp89 [Halorubrum virus HRTV-15]UBF20290.1 hypothetical protein HSTV-4_gp83 [Halorubrum sodomense tailed virus 4]UBF21720.1 hypothetical protein HJTV-2_gp100 [Haloarcula virus HJTV-2]
MSDVMAGLAVFGAMFLVVVALLPVFLLQKEISEKRNEDRRAKLEKQLENEKLL